MRTEIECCEGLERYQEECLKDRCPEYRTAKDEIDRDWPYTATGFGNLHGWPSVAQYQEKVRENLQSNPNATRINKK